jgi:arabinogalactan oligomer/maltooligosaccharide transport system permease protein
VVPGVQPQINAAAKPATRHARIGALLSFLFMGLGQLYHRQFVKGFLYILLEIYVVLFMTNPIFKGLWGLYTLGEKAQVRKRAKIVEQGDHSIFLMIEGLIILLLVIIFLLVYYRNIVDAYKTGKRRDSGLPVNSFAASIQNAWDNGYAYILLTPAFLFTMFLTILPLLFGILIAFTNYAAPNHIPPKHLVDWVGLDTFASLFQLKSWSRTFWGVTAWTFIWAILSTVTTFFVGMLYAVMINYKKIRFKRFWRTVFILPWAVPGFISILIFRNIFNGQFGPLNQYLQAVGLQAIPWLSEPFWAKFALVTVNIWFGFPFWMALMSGVLAGIDKDMYEAAEVDGASGWQKFWNITFPLVMFATAPLLIMSFAGNFNNFNIIYLFTGGGPVNVEYSYAGATDILISWIYKLTLDQNQFNMASVISIIIFVFVAIFSVWNFRRTRAFKEEDMIQ